MKRILCCFTVLLFCYECLSFGKDYKGAEYRTKEAYIYGRFEVRYKPPKGDGFLASFFAYHEISSSIEWNEIDFEILGRYDHDVLVTSIGPGQKTRNSHQWVAFNASADFHNYALEWTPDYIAWFIDDKEVYRQTQEHIAEFKYDQKIMMNIWQPSWTPWAGILDDRALPVFAFYDWVSYAAFTPGSGNTGTNNNFTLQWRDDFDSWDQNRWEKATHTFSGNNCNFVPENAVFKDGYLILCLTKPNSLGYVDLTPPAVQWARAFENKIIVGFTETLEPSSAQKTTNYQISGNTISEAKLLQDGRTVELTVSDLNPDNTYNLIALGIRDNTSAHNMMVGQVVNLIMVKPLTFPLKINVGGEVYQDYLPDQLWSPELEYGHQDGYEESWSATIDIQGTEQDSVYLTGLHEVVCYKIRVPNGRYQVTLMMAENEFSESGRRLFDIQIEDHLIASGLDLFQQVGDHTACQIVADNVEIEDEMIDIHCTNRWNFSLLNGIVVEQIDTEIKDSGDRSIPNQFHFFQNYPNPFNSSTAINYDLPTDGYLNIAVYNLQGQEVRQLINKLELAGKHQIIWNADVATGIYLLKIKFLTQENRFSGCRKMILMR